MVRLDLKPFSLVTVMVLRQPVFGSCMALDKIVLCFRIVGGTSNARTLRLNFCVFVNATGYDFHYGYCLVRVDASGQLAHGTLRPLRFL